MRGDLLADLDDFLPGEADPSGHDPVERLAFDIFHREKRRSFVSAAREQADDVGMLQLLEDVDFALEAERAPFSLPARPVEMNLSA